ncbi:hypothetical protein ACLKA7_013923 [Drosophila subpalustris]
MDDVVSLRIICSNARNCQYNIEELDMYGNTALLKACYMGRYECVRVLLDYGADIRAINYFGQNALTLATYAGHLPLVLELLRHRTYQDFNLSSLIPAICVATMQQHKVLEDYFKHLDPRGAEDLHTVHGLGVKELRKIILTKLNRKQPLLSQNKYLHKVALHFQLLGNAVPFRQIDSCCSRQNAEFCRD